MPLAIFGISSSGLSILINLLVLFLVVVYFALVYWTYLDAKRRLEDPILIACATVASLFPFIGTVIYTIVRPPEFLEDVRERDLEIRASELRVRQLIEQSCPYCEYPIERQFVRCPNCERRLKNPCRSCKQPLDPKWGVCPYCETEVQKQKPAAEGRRAPRRTARSGTRRTQRQPAARSGNASGQRAASGNRSAAKPRQSSGGGTQTRRTQRSSDPETAPSRTQR